jgi:hypothetical protein
VGIGCEVVAFMVDRWAQCIVSYIPCRTANSQSAGVILALPFFEADLFGPEDIAIAKWGFYGSIGSGGPTRRYQSLVYICLD